jgi:hypothetical protein
MIARRVGGNPIPGVLVREAKNRIARSAKLEGAHFLEILTLTNQLSAGQVIQACAGQYGGIMRIWFDAGSGDLYVCEGRVLQHGILL